MLQEVFNRTFLQFTGSLKLRFLSLIFLETLIKKLYSCMLYYIVHKHQEAVDTR